MSAPINGNMKSSGQETEDVPEAIPLKEISCKDGGDDEEDKEIQDKEIAAAGEKGEVEDETNKGVRCGVCAGCQQCCQALRQGCGEIRDACGPFSCKDCVRNTCTVDLLKKRVPILKWLPKYR